MGMCTISLFDAQCFTLKSAFRASRLAIIAIMVGEDDRARCPSSWVGSSVMEKISVMLAEWQIGRDPSGERAVFVFPSQNTKSTVTDSAQ